MTPRPGATLEEVMLIEIKRLVRTAGSVYKKVRALNQDIPTAIIDASPSKTFNNEMHEFYSLFKRGMTENHKLYVAFHSRRYNNDGPMFGVAK